MFDYASVDRAVGLIVRALSPEMVIVFGSVAKGTATDASDLDILVVMETDLPFPYREVRVRDVISGIKVPKDVLVMTPVEYAERREDPWDIAYEIARTGWVVYDASKC